MHYRFPTINDIRDVLPYINGDAGFRVVEKDCGNTYINYVRLSPDTFPPVPSESHWPIMDAFDVHDFDEAYHNAVIRRECRGLAFDTETGKLVSRPFHKFFNVGEREEMDIASLGFSYPHVVLDKVDGSMVRPVPTKYGIRWATKMGITDTAMLTETWLVGRDNYYQMAEYCMQQGLTPIFEYVSPENRIVVDYGRRDMILLAIRHNQTGDYTSYEGLLKFGEDFDIPVVRAYGSVSGDPSAYVSHIKDSSDFDEGIVIRWENGHMAKVKTETYVALHKIKESGRTERTLVMAILESQIDDMLAIVTPEVRKSVENYVEGFWRYMDSLGREAMARYLEIRDRFDTKKDFAIWSQDELSPLDRGIVFGLWDGKLANGEAVAMQILKTGLTSETSWVVMKERLADSVFLPSWELEWKGGLSE